jgi:hypothetical protein
MKIQAQTPGISSSQTALVRSSLQRVHISASAFAENPPALADIRFKALGIKNVPLVAALTAWALDEMFSNDNFSTLKQTINISYQRGDEGQTYIGLFSLDPGKAGAVLLKIKNDSVRADVKASLTGYSLEAKTRPFFVADENIDITSNPGIETALGEADDAYHEFLQLKEPTEKIYDQLRARLDTFVKTQFVKQAGEIIQELLGIIA